MRLTHRMLEVFRTLIQTGNATRTAELLFTSQPSISRDLSRLEQVTGLILFERRGGRLYPSAQALTLYEEVQRSFVGLDAIAARAETLRSLGEGQVHLAALPCLCDTLLPAACERFSKDLPGISLRIETLESPQLEHTLITQQADLGLVEHLDPLPDVASRLLFEGDEQVLLPAGHALAARTILQPADFQDLPFVSFAPHDVYRRRIDAVFQEHGVQRRLVIEASTASAVCALVEQGIGLAIVNPISAAQAERRGLLVRAFSVPIPYRIALAKPLLRPGNPLVDLFCQTLQNEAQAFHPKVPAHPETGTPAGGRDAGVGLLTDCA